MDLSVIVPTLDEERTLGVTLARLGGASNDVIVVDGGSTDATRAIARAHGARWIDSEPGRGVQLNRGAAAARGDVLLFLHADTLLPADATAHIETAISRGAVGGGFLVEFESERPIMAVGSRLVNVRTRLTSVPLGDQGQFARRDAFVDLGGFRDWPILEDLDLMRRLKQSGRVEILPVPVLTSDRRYAQRGITRTVLTNHLIWTLYALGVHPRKLGRLYRQVR